MYFPTSLADFPNFWAVNPANLSVKKTTGCRIIRVSSLLKRILVPLGTILAPLFSGGTGICGFARNFWAAVRA
jgi:hypothetical protein